MAKKRTKKTAAKKSKKNGVAALMDELFQAAVALRGSIETPDYKRYVLPLIFLRFLSLRYEHRRAELEGFVDDTKSEWYTDDPATREAILEDPDAYVAAGAFIVPKAARWSELIAQAQADDIKLKVDAALELLEQTYPEQLRGLLPKVFARSNMEPEDLGQLIALFSKDVFREDHGGEDLVGRVYEYFIGEFASAEGKRGGEYFTPGSIVRTLVAMLEPTEGIVFDPCCGSGGMFVQSDVFAKHSGQLSFVGQEAKDFTYRLCRMNLFIHGINGNIEQGNSYTDDKHATLKADYLLANPPFNDGSKGENGWGADRIPDKDPRLVVAGERMPLATRNANTMWIMHFLHHLKEGGTAGFVMAAGELSNGEGSRAEVRAALVESGYVDCVVQLSGKLFANTPSPCALWFLSKNRHGVNGYRNRKDEILFIDGRALGKLIPGSATQHELLDDEIGRIASLYREFCTSGPPETVQGFATVATLDEVRAEKHALTPARYVPAPPQDEEDEAFEEKFPRLVLALNDLVPEVHGNLVSLQEQLSDLPGLREALDLTFDDTDRGPLPTGWQHRTLGELTTLLRRGRAPRYLEVGGVCVLNQKCVRHGMIDFGPSRRHDASARPIEDRALEFGDVLVNSTGVGTLGRVAQVWWLYEPTTVDSHVTILRPDPEEIMPEVFGAILLGLQSEFDRMGEGSTGQTELGRERLASIYVPVPPRDLQEQLAPLLKSTQTALANQRRLFHDTMVLRDCLLPRLVAGELATADLTVVEG